MGGRPRRRRLLWQGLLQSGQIRCLRHRHSSSIVNHRFFLWNIHPTRIRTPPHRKGKLRPPPRSHRQRVESEESNLSTNLRLRALWKGRIPVGKTQTPSHLRHSETRLRRSIRNNKRTLSLFEVARQRRLRRMYDPRYKRIFFYIREKKHIVRDKTCVLYYLYFIVLHCVTM